MNATSRRAVATCRIFVVLAAVYVIAASLLVLIGWAVNDERLISLFPALNGKVLPFLGQLHSASAICLIALSLALLCSLSRRRSSCIISLALSCFVILSSCPAIYVAISQEDFEPLRVLQPDPSASGITFPVPMSLEVAVSLILLALSVLILNIPLERQKVRISQIVSAASVVIPLLIVLGAATRLPQICALGGCFTMSTGFAVLCICLAAAIFLSRPDRDLAAMFTAGTISGAILRRMVAFLIIVPFLLIGRTVAVHSQLDLDEPTGWLIFTFLLMFSMVALTITGAGAINRIDQERLKISLELEQVLKNQKEPSPASDLPEPKYKRVCLICAGEFPDGQNICSVDRSELSRVLDDSLLGAIFLDKYVIKELLGSGGMSTVYRATHLYVNKDVAVKVLKAKSMGNPEHLKRFMREARAVGSLNHPGIVSVSDVGLTENGHAFIIMEFIGGVSLSDLLDKRVHLGQKEFIDVVRQVCDAVAYAHERGIIHRDLKPSNIMLCTDANGESVVKIVDFGMARVLEEEGDPMLKVTITGDCFGTPLYMSPEQCNGRRADELSDIYALGCIFFECLTGIAPIVGADVQETLRKQKEEGPASFPDEARVPLHIQGAIYKALQKDPERRQKSVMQLKQELLFDTHAVVG